MPIRLVLTALASLLAGGMVALLVLPGARELLLPVRTALVTTGKASIGGPFNLVAHTGQRMSDQDFRGQYLLIYFGFTFCPDICPSALQVVAAALDKLGDKADRITPVLITVDPERDGPEELARYVSSFHPRLVGLTGTLPEVEAAAKAYRVYFRKAKDQRSAADYTIDHTSIIYLMDPSGEYVTHFTHATSVETMAARLAKLH